jgi:hypothetical protein
MRIYRSKIITPKQHPRHECPGPNDPGPFRGGRFLQNFGTRNMLDSQLARRGRRNFYGTLMDEVPPHSRPATSFKSCSMRTGFAM